MTSAVAAEGGIARQAFALLTSKSWVSAKFVFIQASRTSWSTNDFAATDGSAGWTSNPRSLDQAWAALRKAMADPDKGTWLAGELTLQPSGASALSFEYDVRPFRRGGPFKVLRVRDGGRVLLEYRGSDRGWAEGLPGFAAGDYHRTSGEITGLVDVADISGVSETSTPLPRS